MPAQARAGPAVPADVMLVGYQDQGNLGMGYLAAVLQQHGRTVECVDVREGTADLVTRATAGAQPLVVGFSLIFQFFLPQYREACAALRAAGVTSHLTIGGHYPSLCPDEVLAQMPELDSVTRYEGELTLLDLVEHLDAGDDWRQVPGLAWIDANGTMVDSMQRALVHDLDSLPLPHRPYEPLTILGFPTMPLLASRGCARRCSFCSIHTFYRTAPGKTVRVRSAARVVEEMRLLYEQRGVRVFLFQDDDFPLWGKPGRKWVDELALGLERCGLAERVIWKISCRAEYVEPELFSRLRDVGLFLVYMGIESGVDQGLEVLHKQLTTEQNLTGVQVLKDIGVMFSYGFMLFDPSSTFASVRENVAFLREIVGDGSAAAVFCRMLPYGGTPIRDRLEMEGRLRGTVTHPDYDFLDRRLNAYHSRLDRTVASWIHNDGLSHQLNWAWEEVRVAERLASGLIGLSAYSESLRQLTAFSNETLFELVERSSLAYERGDDPQLEPWWARSTCRRIKRELLRLRNEWVVANQEALLEAVAIPTMNGPVMLPQVH